MTEPLVVVVGSGSVGRRHLTNLHDLGCLVSAVDPRPDRLAQAASEVPLVGTAPELSDSILQGASGVVIASPPAFHVPQASLALASGAAVLLEKPVSHSLRDAVALAAIPGALDRVLVGYTYRWWPAILELRRRVAQGDVGRVLHASCTMAAHLADWHPWERYQDFFMSSAELGGGALLDESHVIDLMLWFFGMPAELGAAVDRLSDLEIDSDDNVDLVWRAPDGPQVTIHLDLYSRPHERSIVIRGTEGTIRWTFDPNRLEVSQGNEAPEAVSFDDERNDMFVAVAREFLDVVSGARPSCDLRDGVDVLRVVEVARRVGTAGGWGTVPA